MPASRRSGGFGTKFFSSGATVKPEQPPGNGSADRALDDQPWLSCARLVAQTLFPMSTENFDRLLAAATDFDASDLHLVAGVPPAFRVNGEIIIADEDALTQQDVAVIADSLLNEQQKRKFEQEWELCISMMRKVAGRVRATCYRRNSSPEMSFRFCGER